MFVAFVISGTILRLLGFRNNTTHSTPFQKTFRDSKSLILASNSDQARFSPSVAISGLREQAFNQVHRDET